MKTRPLLHLGYAEMSGWVSKRKIERIKYCKNQFKRLYVFLFPSLSWRLPQTPLLNEFIGSGFVLLTINISVSNSTCDTFFYNKYGTEPRAHVYIDACRKQFFSAYSNFLFSVVFWLNKWAHLHETFFSD